MEFVDIVYMFQFGLLDMIEANLFQYLQSSC